mgnify:CR=1 FL=1
MKSAALLSLSCVAFSLLTGCKPGASSPSPDSEPARSKPLVLASNTPLSYFASRIGGDLIDASYPGPADEDPAFWEPSDQDAARLQSADLILLNGATYEKWLDHVTLAASKLIDTSAIFEDAYLDSGHSETHSHGPEGDHSHAGTAFTTWIDFQLAKAQSTQVHQALVKQLADQNAALATGLQSLTADLDALDERMTAVAKRIGSQPLVASHPVYQYWANRYKLNVKAVLWEPEVVPGDDQMKALQEIVASHPAKWMIWEGDPDPASVSKLKAIGIESLVFDPCGGPAEEGDWLTVMRSNLETLEAAFPAP